MEEDKKQGFSHGKTSTLHVLTLSGSLLRKAIISFYYMAVSHKDWELPNSRIWLAEIDIDRGLDFPI